MTHIETVVHGLLRDTWTKQFLVPTPNDSGGTGENNFWCVGSLGSLRMPIPVMLALRLSLAECRFRMILNIKR